MPEAVRSALSDLIWFACVPTQFSKLFVAYCGKNPICEVPSVAGTIKGGVLRAKRSGCGIAYTFDVGLQFGQKVSWMT